MAKKVMIVDDDYTMNSLLKMLMELDGFGVVIEPDGHSVLNTLRKEKPDVVLMDVHIGDTDGMVLLREIRKTPELAALPVVMSSGMDVEEQCHTAGATAFILKPYPPDQLSALLKKVLS